MNDSYEDYLAALTVPNGSESPTVRVEKLRAEAEACRKLASETLDRSPNTSARYERWAALADELAEGITPVPSTEQAERVDACYEVLSLLVNHDDDHEATERSLLIIGVPAEIIDAAGGRWWANTTPMRGEGPHD